MGLEAGPSHEVLDMDSAEVDEAVPADGIPDRAKTNALLKSIVGILSIMPLQRRSTGKPVAMDSPGNVGDYYIDINDGIYICVAEDTWRVLYFYGWE